MSVEMWIGVVLMAWCVVSVPVGLMAGAILGKLAAAPQPPSEQVRP